MKKLNQVTDSIVEEVASFNLVAIAKAPSSLNKVPKQLIDTHSVFSGAWLDCMYIGFDKAGEPTVFVARNSSFLKPLTRTQVAAFGKKLTTAIDKFKAMALSEETQT